MRTSQLDAVEQFVVRSFRRWVLGLHRNDSFHWSYVWTDFVVQFGQSDGGTALAGFARFILGLQGNARRSIAYHMPCCPCLCADEVSIVNLVAACQKGRLSHARALAEWLVHGDAVGDLLDTASQLARLMACHGLVFGDRAEPAWQGGGDTVSQCSTVH